MKVKEVIEFLRSLKWEEGYYRCSVHEHNIILDNIIRRIKRYDQETYKKAWVEFIYGLAHINIGSYQNPNNNIQMTDLECVNKIVDNIKQKYFPKEELKWMKI